MGKEQLEVFFKLKIFLLKIVSVLYVFRFIVYKVICDYNINYKWFLDVSGVEIC